MHARCDLVSVGFVRGSFEHPAQAIGDGQTRGGPPSILPIELVVIDGVAAVDRRALRQRAAVAREVIVAVTLGKTSPRDRSRAVVIGAEVAVHRRKAVVGGIQRAGSTSDSPRVEINRVGANVRKGVRVAGVVVTDEE